MYNYTEVITDEATIRIWESGKYQLLVGEQKVAEGSSILNAVKAHLGLYYAVHDGVESIEPGKFLVEL